MDSVVLKQCVDCGGMFPTEKTHFRLVNNRNGKPGNLQPYCRACERARDAKRRESPEFRARRAEANRKWGAKRKLAVRPADQPDLMRLCPRCGTPKPQTSEFFGRHATGRDGFNCYCLLCTRRESKNQRAKRPGYAKAYYLARRASIKGRTHAYYHANREDIRARERLKRKSPEALDRLRVHEQNRRARKKLAPGRFTRLDVRQKLDYQGGRCLYCGGELESGYHIEHKIPLSRGGSNWPANIGLSCGPCNLRKNTKTFREYTNR